MRTACVVAAVDSCFAFVGAHHRGRAAELDPRVQRIMLFTGEVSQIQVHLFHTIYIK